MDQMATFQLRCAARKTAAMPDTNVHSGEDLADWLQEAAKRPWVGAPLPINHAVLPGAGPEARRESRLRRHLQQGRELVALAVLTLGFLQYYYLDVMVQIGYLHKVVVFVPLTAA